MAEQKDTLAELRRLAETVLKVSALDAAGIDAYMAYVHATKARTVLKLLDLVEAAKEVAEFQRGYEFQPTDRAGRNLAAFDAALAALEGEEGRGGR